MPSTVRAAQDITVVEPRASGKRLAIKLRPSTQSARHKDFRLDLSKPQKATLFTEQPRSPAIAIILSKAFCLVASGASASSSCARLPVPCGITFCAKAGETAITAIAVAIATLRILASWPF